MNQLTVLAPPAEAIVPLAEAKAYLRVGHGREDDLISGLIERATARLETQAGQVFVQRTLQLRFQTWSAVLGGRGLMLSPGPVTRLISVTQVSSDASETDLSDVFALEAGRLCLRATRALPRLSDGDSVNVTFEAGFGTAADVPADLKQAVLVLIGQAYSARSVAGFDYPAERAGLPGEVQAVLSARRGARL